MEAGRELDALVAEQVMGWKKIDGVWKGPRGETMTLLDATVDNIAHSCCPPYSTSIADALSMAMAIKCATYFSLLAPGNNYGNGIEWSAGWANDDYDGPSFAILATASTAPLAICRAAIQWAESQKERRA